MSYVRRIWLRGLIVEDLQLGLDGAKAGHAPIFCPFARVTSEFASSAAGVATQRARWEHGHIQTILKMVPALLWQSIKGKNTELLALTLDFSCSSTFAIGHAYGRNVLTWIAWRAFRLFEARCVYQHRKHLKPPVIATIFAWLKCGREVLPFARSILSIVPYMTSKIGLYARIAFQRMQENSVDQNRPHQLRLERRLCLATIKAPELGI